MGNTNLTEVDISELEKIAKELRKKILKVILEKLGTTEKDKELKEQLNQDKDKLGIKSIIDVDGVRVIFEDGWGLVRASNTTPVIVTRFEAKTLESLDTIQNKLMNILKLKLSKNLKNCIKKERKLLNGKFNRKIPRFD